MHQLYHLRNHHAANFQNGHTKMCTYIEHNTLSPNEGTLKIFTA